MARILVVEDESNLAQGLLFNLQAEGHDGKRGCRRRGGSGVPAARGLRRRASGRDAARAATVLRSPPRCVPEGNYVPILMLTARGRPEDIVQGFAAGRGRLPAQAVRPERAAGAPQRPAAAHELAPRTRGNEAMPRMRLRSLPSPAGASTSTLWNCTPPSASSA